MIEGVMIEGVRVMIEEGKDEMNRYNERVKFDKG